MRQDKRYDSLRPLRLCAYWFFDNGYDFPETAVGKKATQLSGRLKSAGKNYGRSV
jgi:hypothetical protein